MDDERRFDQNSEVSRDRQAKRDELASYQAEKRIAVRWSPRCWKGRERARCANEVRVVRVERSHNDRVSRSGQQSQGQRR